MPGFEQLMLLLLAAVIIVPLAARLGLGAVLGYLLAGVIVGPWALSSYRRGRADPACGGVRGDPAAVRHRAGTAAQPIVGTAQGDLWIR